MAAARLAQCDSFIRTLPDGYDTVISCEQSILSQCQQQLLTIARAALANPNVMVLDEALPVLILSPNNGFRRRWAK